MAETKNKEAEKGQGTEENTAVEKTESFNMSERFTHKVLSEFGSNVAGALQVSDYQRQLIQGYFVGIDRSLKIAEEGRIRKNKNNKDHKYDNDLVVSWTNINLNDLALDVVHYARMGLDMMQKNNLFPIPYKNNKTNKYDVTLMTGYNGIRYMAEKYAVEVPTAVTIELVYTTDVFKPIKKSSFTEVESYDFDIVNPFNRGEIIGGFGYIEYSDKKKNKLIIMSRAEIEKRKPAYAAAEFWGGKTKGWEAGKQVEKDSDGWIPEMYTKTLVREVYSAKNMPVDPKKIDDAYQYMKLREARYAEMEADAEIEQNANGDIIDVDGFEVAQQETPPVQIMETDSETGEIIPGESDTTNGTGKAEF